MINELQSKILRILYTFYLFIFFFLKEEIHLEMHQTERQWLVELIFNTVENSLPLPLCDHPAIKRRFSTHN